MFESAGKSNVFIAGNCLNCLTTSQMLQTGKVTVFLVGVMTKNGQDLGPSLALTTLASDSLAPCRCRKFSIGPHDDIVTGADRGIRDTVGIVEMMPARVL